MLAGASSFVIAMYRPASQLITKAFFKKLSTLLERLSTYSVAVTITGDINIHFEQAADVNTCKIMETLEYFGFHQFINTPTHELGGILDVIVASNDHPQEDIVIDDVGLSNHMLVSWAVNLAPKLPVYVATTRHTWRTFKTEDFISQLRLSALCTPDDSDSSIDHLTDQYKDIITVLVDEMAPSKTVTTWERPRRLWYNDDYCR